jgi:hypothetical protein
MHEEIHHCQRYKLPSFLFCFFSMPRLLRQVYIKSRAYQLFPRHLLFMSMETTGDTVRLILPSYGWNGLNAMCVEAVGLQLMFVVTSPVMLKMQKLLIFRLWLS